MKFYIIIFLMSLISCKKENKDQHSNDNIIDLTNVYNKNLYNVKLGEIASKIDYIPLHTSDNSLLGKVQDESKNIKFIEGKILIKDELDNLVLFNSKGGFLTKIGTLGKGPGEYMKINGFTFLPNEELIALNSRQEKRIMLYNYNGRFKYEFSTEFQTNDLFSFDDYLVSINNFDFREYSGYYNLSFFSKNGGLKRKLLYKKHEQAIKKKLGERIYWSYNSRSVNSYVLNNNYYYWEHGLYDSKDTVWEISKNLISKPSFVFYYGGKKPAMESYYTKKSISVEDGFKLIHIDGFVDTKNYMFIGLFRLGKKNIILRNKKDGSNILIGYQKPYSSGFNFVFENDIDGGVPFWPTGQISDNKIFMLVNGYEVKDYLERQGDNYKAKDSKTRQQLLELVEPSRISDNPILMVVTLKE